MRKVSMIRKLMRQIWLQTQIYSERLMLMNMEAVWLPLRREAKNGNERIKMQI